MGLGHDKSLFFAVCHDEEFYCLFPESSFLAVIGNNGCYCGGGAFVSEYLFGFVEVVEVAEIDSYYILPGLGILIGLLCLFVGSL